MSSFGENFERDENKDIQFDSNAFYPVIESFIFLLIFFCLYKIYSILFKYKVKYQDQTKYRNCQCRACINRLNNLVKKKENNKSLTFYIGALIFLSLLSSKYYKKIIETQNKIKVFDPYEILEISHSANDKEIKKSFKKLALKYHPDKNLNNIQAKAKFMLITKAYESLTNENSKKNFELYGNPDGPGSMRFSIGLPSSFILDKKNHNKILIIFIVIVCVIIPHYFCNWVNRSKNFDENGLLNITKEYFMTHTNEKSTLKHIPFLLGICHEFTWIDDNDIEQSKNEIETLFNKYKNEFPDDEDSKRIVSYLKLKNKKAIGIAYAYSYGDRHDLNYATLNKVNDYIILLAKLLDAFFDSHNAKNLIFKIAYTHGVDKSSIKFPEVSPDFMKHIIMFQQCFYQGIPIPKIQTNISYVQLPYINTDNIQLITKSDENILFRNFLKKSDDDKKIFLKKIFNFDDEQINEIIASTHSIPQYEYKIKHYVENFENTDIIPDDTVTFKITIIRKNVGKLNVGITHTKYFPGLFNECIIFTVMTGKNGTIVAQEKVKITKKVTEFKLPIKVITVGENIIKFSAKPSCTYGLNDVIDGTIQCVAESEKRKKLLEDINKRKEKIPLSYMQEALKEAGIPVQNDSDSDEEEEDDDEKDKDKNEKEENNEENKDENINKKAINNQDDI